MSEFYSWPNIETAKKADREALEKAEIDELKESVSETEEEIEVEMSTRLKKKK